MTKLADYKYVRVHGDAWTPQRFWGYTFCTEKEYQYLPENTRNHFRIMDETDRQKCKLLLEG